MITLISCTTTLRAQNHLLTGAEQTDQYLPLLKNKRVAVCVNHTSVIKTTHLVDSLRALGVNIIKIFVPEHGFRGTADAGEKINDSIDKKTSLPIYSLYGKNKIPTAAQLSNVDIVIFDLQDVGARFYTYISTMHYLMNACAGQNIPFVVLDRPNPNGHYVDGPVLEKKYSSFVGLHPIPIVHGLTVGELAQMINGEKWLDSNKVCPLTVIPCKNYSHKTSYTPPVKPSPNLPNRQSMLLYPSLCLFEGTVISVGRGTDYPFQVIGAPHPQYGNYTFTPQSKPGAKNPMYQNMMCYGLDLRNHQSKPALQLQFLLDMYARCPDKKNFFTPFFNKLAGNESLQEQIKSGYTEEQIKQTWQASLNQYKAMRKKYLLYEDFE
ncbi:MAG: DUF1343 domain-containing protein [Cytophagaceae bacterium]|nr:DUF1343 domain-containing protein [Cytophagaceae bacterium]MDW8456478.1 DUF1343 domain-containing protein [Cytophagaceae bacterium]